MRPILVGEAPGPNTDPYRPLNCDESTSAGGRLRDIMRIDRDQYNMMFDKINLMPLKPDRWSIPESREKADKLMRFLYNRDVFLLGKRVAHAFGMMERQFFDGLHCGQTVLYVVPHPSGLNRWYNDAENVEISRQFWHDTIEGYILYNECDIIENSQ